MVTEIIVGQLAASHLINRNHLFLVVMIWNLSAIATIQLGSDFFKLEMMLFGKLQEVTLHF